MHLAHPMQKPFESKSSGSSTRCCRPLSIAAGAVKSNEAKRVWQEHWWGGLGKQMWSAGVGDCAGCVMQAQGVYGCGIQILKLQQPQPARPKVLGKVSCDKDWIDDAVNSLIEPEHRKFADCFASSCKPCVVWLRTQERQSCFPNPHKNPVTIPEAQVSIAANTARRWPASAPGKTSEDNFRGQKG